MILRTMIMGESSVQLPSQHPVDEIKKMMAFENLKVHTESNVQVAVVVLGLYAVLGTQESRV